MALPDAPVISVSTTFDGNDISWEDVAGATSYDLYWIISSVSNETFDDLDDWSITENGLASASISSGQVVLDCNTTGNYSVSITRRFGELEQDFTMDIDLVSYDPDNVSGGLKVIVSAYSQDRSANYVQLNCLRNATHAFRIRLVYQVNGGSVYSGSYTNLAAPPSKMRITRSGTTLEIWYYDGSWNSVESKDFGVYAPDINRFQLYAATNSNWGGSVTFDNLNLSPQATESSGLIANVTSPYSHNLPEMISRSVHAYHIIAKNADGNSYNSNICYILPWQHYYLGPDRDNAIELFPDEDYSRGELEKRTIQRTTSGEMYDYKLYDYKQISFSTVYVPASEASIVNSWWNSQTKLQWFTELGSVSTVDSVMLKNNSTPFSELSVPYPDYYEGKIILEEYV